jgi:hypothetical protein
LSRLFRNKFLMYQRKSVRQGKLKFHGEMAGLAQSGAFETLCREARSIEWVVYAKAPFGGPEHVLKYLARYTHRVAISNRRLVSMQDGRVTFQWKDYAGASKIKTMTLDAVEFIRRFLLHVLPGGFVRIRQFGFLSNRVRKEKLALCRTLLATEPPTTSTAGFPQDAKIDYRDHTLCPVCKTGRLVPVEIVPPAARPLIAFCPRQDSS